jgi:hypothetical protein
MKQVLSGSSGKHRLVREGLHSTLGGIKDAEENDEAVNKLQAETLLSVLETAIVNRLNTLEDAQVKVTYFEVVSATSGTITPPSGATILLDQFASSVDALVSKVDGSGNPTYITPQTVGGTYIATTLDALGAYVLTDTPADATVAIIYVYSVSRANFDITKSVGFEETNLFTNTDRVKLAIASTLELGYLVGVTSGIQAQLDGKLNTPTISFVTGSNATNNTTTLANITGLSNALLANSTYTFEAMITGLTSADTDGVGYAIDFSSSGATIEAGVIGATVVAGARAPRITLATSTPTHLTTANQTGIIIIKGTVWTGVNAGNLTVQHKKFVSGLSTVYVGSSLETIKR